MEAGERGALPVAGVEADGDDDSLARSVPLQRALHLDAVAEIGIGEGGADEQENHVGRVQVLFNLAAPVCSGLNLAVVPVDGLALAPQEAEVLF